MRGVVVGDEHDGLLAVGVAGLGDDVVRRAARQQAAEQVRAGGDVVGDRGRRGEPGGGGERPPAAREPGERAGGREQRDRDGERAGGPLLLDPRRRAELGEAVAQPARGLALARRGRRAVDRLQVLDDGAQAVGSGGMRGGP